MIRSMTGFAAARGEGAGHDWAFDLRSVNGRGLDLRLRLPDWIEGLEPILRARLSKAVQRGNVTLSLRVAREEARGGLRLNEAALGAALDALGRAEAEAMVRGVTLAPATAADLLGLRGVIDTAPPEEGQEALRALLIDAFEPVLAAFLEMREHEGAALAEILAGQLDEVERLVTEAEALLPERAAGAERALRDGLARVLANVEADEARIAQELALIAMKADITEELDRLRAHLAAARALLAEGGTVGRKLDFLTQEFNREANTLCAKSNHAGLTRVGLALKAVIDQMREQAQNVE
ncbi:MAG: YicC/YloC family endoribonuclease [Paracoccaceae bacterium]